MLSTRLPLELMQTKWAAELNPLLALPILNGVLLTGVTLKAGDNVINTKIQRQQQGWLIVDQSAGATVYRSKPLNNTTLTLNSSAPCVVSLWVF